MRLASLTILLILSTACRVERTWHTRIDLTRGEVRDDVWVATQAEQVEAGHEARSCAPPSITTVSEGLAVTLIDWDEWAGECWGLVQVQLGADAPATTQAEFQFSFDLCEIDGGCPADLIDQTQLRTLTVTAH